jgi:chromatin remodeling complex protein RSC6
MAKKRETTPTLNTENTQQTSVKKTVKKSKKEQLPVTETLTEPVLSQVQVVEQVVQVADSTPQQPESEEKVSTSRAVSVDTVDTDFNTLLDTLTTLSTTVPKGELAKGLRTVLKQCKSLQKDVRRVVRKKKRTPRNGNQTGGLMKPVLISNELADFLGVEHGSELSRTEVTRKMSPILQTMQNPENKRVLKPSKELTKLLKYNNKEHGDLYYYTVQKLIQPHFK